MVRKQRKNVGLIGLGIIGSRAAIGLRAAGYSVFVWNRTPRAAPNFLASPAEVARVCETIQLFVADARALFEVIDAMGDAITPQHLLILSATVGREATLEAADLLAKKGAQLLDAPFTGSKAAAEKRQLVYYVGGDEAALLRAQPILEATSKAIVPIGKLGDAAVVKVVTNMIAAVSIQTLAEALAIVRKTGIDPEVFAVALEQNACRSGTMDLKLPKMISGDYEPHFSLKHMFKDVQLGVHLAHSLGLEIPATTVTAGTMYGAVNHGWGDLDFASLFRLYEQALGKKSVAAEPAPAAPAQPAVVASAPALEVVASVPPDAKAAADAIPEERAPANEQPAAPAGPEVLGKPFNRIKRFFSPNGGNA